ncbi:hypothetical protein AWM75_00640 [Aerococcus urinaehominis]|uniref:Uncharacterized protein n=1 Tax=Aerococcus urinaehominis TaxID=128944 RepID=A0A120IAM7_9LACT|nr:hypothetical protein [Aerococcus urinaehominis]AMB98588.1 hypothetical protein AWM75_00640 [Aerococcus urinaehominis]SDL76738.1 hypothetical protein SAMN04487985_10117 [Aerococcus urinaehominis]
MHRWRDRLSASFRRLTSSEFLAFIILIAMILFAGLLPHGQILTIAVAVLIYSRPIYKLWQAGLVAVSIIGTYLMLLGGWVDEGRVYGWLTILGLVAFLAKHGVADSRLGQQRLVHSLMMAGLGLITLALTAVIIELLPFSLPDMLAYLPFNLAILVALLYEAASSEGQVVVVEADNATHQNIGRALMIAGLLIAGLSVLASVTDWQSWLSAGSAGSTRVAGVAFLIGFITYLLPSLHNKWLMWLLTACYLMLLGLEASRNYAAIWADAWILLLVFLLIKTIFALSLTYYYGQRKLVGPMLWQLVLIYGLLIYFPVFGLNYQVEARINGLEIGQALPDHQTDQYTGYYAGEWTYWPDDPDQFHPPTLEKQSSGSVHIRPVYYRLEGTVKDGQVTFDLQGHKLSKAAHTEANQIKFDGQLLADNQTWLPLDDQNYILINQASIYDYQKAAGQKPKITMEIQAIQASFAD